MLSLLGMGMVNWLTEKLSPFSKLTELKPKLAAKMVA